jgi:putative FmdB family regulatory protein
MPTYNYHCENCNWYFDEFFRSVAEWEKAKEENNIECPTCHSKNLKNLITLPAVKFKGNGWTPKGNANTTSKIREHTEQIQEDMKNTKSDDLFKDTDNIIPKDIG